LRRPAPRICGRLQRRNQTTKNNELAEIGMLTGVKCAEFDAAMKA
jgi:hypothetical protein